ncbi:HD domain-containing protein [Cupriavidus necator]|uniref:HD domain-containing protein n=1 Tax=Cupriavidus necator TaxID=106590 RepID=A0A1U9UYM0_CUPNE|nr:HD domain-containing protein [Cupriavidus necator]AQV97828.1 HD domain-containing protein [Cupriavidus necator]
MSVNPTQSSRFTRLDQSTREDWQSIAGEFRQLAAGLPDRILAHLKLLDGDFGGFPVDRYTHSLQTATLALRDGRDEEYVVCALLHDIGDTLGTFNHPDAAATLLQPFVSEENHWMVKYHGIFQGYFFFHHLGMDRDLRDQFRAHPCYERTAEFCARYDNPAFDPHGETLPISEFEPMVRRVFARPRNGVYKAAMDTNQAAR